MIGACSFPQRGLQANKLGRFYQPMIAVEAMYEATINARAKGQWVEIVEAGK